MYVLEVGLRRSSLEVINSSAAHSWSSTVFCYIQSLISTKQCQVASNRGLFAKCWPRNTSVSATSTKNFGPIGLGPLTRSKHRPLDSFMASPHYEILVTFLVLRDFYFILYCDTDIEHKINVKKHLKYLLSYFELQYIPSILWKKALYLLFTSLSSCHLQLTLLMLSVLLIVN